MGKSRFKYRQVELVDIKTRKWWNSYPMAFYCLAWINYPRPCYFQNRLKDTIQRARRITDKLPASLKDENFIKLLEYWILKVHRNLRICVFGTQHLSFNDLVVSPKVKEQDTVTTSDKDYSDISICFTELENLDSTDLVAVQDLILKAAAYRPENILIFCLTNNKKCDNFRQDIIKFCQQFQPNVSCDVVVTHMKDELSQCISKYLETQLIEIFLEIREFLNSFTGRASSHSRIRNILQSKFVSKGILGFLRNGYCLADTVTSKTDRKSFLKALTKKLAFVVKSILIVPISAKYVLPKWVCTRLLHEMDFESQVVESFSKYTHKGLNKLCFFGQSCKHVLENGKQSTYSYRNDAKCLAFDFMLRPIKADLQNTIELMETSAASMEKLSVVMKKMTFEIDGYLKQTNVCLPIPTTDFEVKIPTDLRRDIMLLKGVYGLGTIYGEVEVHLEEGTDDELADHARKIQSLMRKNRFAYPYTIKTVKFY